MATPCLWGLIRLLQTALLQWLSQAQVLAEAPFGGGHRVACIGTGITAGTFSAKSYPKQLQDILGSDYTVRNFGVRHATVLRQGDYPYHVTDEFRDALKFLPHFVVIEFGSNDSKDKNWHAYQNDFGDDYQQIIRAFQSLPSKPEVLVMVPPPLYHKKPYGMNPEVANDAIHDQLTHLAAHMQLQRPVDAFSAFMEHCPRSHGYCDWMKWDGVHPSMSGDQEIARLVSDAVKSQLRVWREAKEDQRGKFLESDTEGGKKVEQERKREHGNAESQQKKDASARSDRGQEESDAKGHKQGGKLTGNEDGMGEGDEQGREERWEGKQAKGNEDKQQQNEGTKKEVAKQGKADRAEGEEGDKEGGKEGDNEGDRKGKDDGKESGKLEEPDLGIQEGKGASKELDKDEESKRVGEGPDDDGEKKSGSKVRETSALRGNLSESSEDASTHALGVQKRVAGSKAAEKVEAAQEEDLDGEGNEEASVEGMEEPAGPETAQNAEKHSGYMSATDTEEEKNPDHEVWEEMEHKLNSAPGESPLSRWRIRMAETTATQYNRSGFRYPRYDARLNHGDEVQLLSSVSMWIAVMDDNTNNNVLTWSAEEGKAATFIVTCPHKGHLHCPRQEISFRCKANAHFVEVGSDAVLRCSSTQPRGTSAMFQADPLSSWEGREYIRFKSPRTGRHIAAADSRPGAPVKANGEATHIRSSWQVYLRAGYETLRPLMRGVTLRGWFLPERCVVQDLFTDGSDKPFRDVCAAMDEYGLMKSLGPDLAKQRMEKHWVSWIQEDDIAWLADHGINTVRVPFGYWMVKPEPPFVPGQLPYLDALFRWCEKRRVGVLLDFHGLKGSQNGRQSSGNCGACNDQRCGKTWINFLRPLEMKVNIEVITALAARYSNSSAYLGFAVASQISRKVNRTAVVDFVRQAYRIIRSNNPNALVVLDEFATSGLFAGEFRDVAVDIQVHVPQLSGDPDNNQEEKLDEVRSKIIHESWPVLIGEWSLNGGGRLRKPGEPVFAQMQLQEWEVRSIGWFYWHYRTMGGSSWSFRDVCVSGLLPGCEGNTSYGPTTWWRSPVPHSMPACRDLKDGSGGTACPRKPMASAVPRALSMTSLFLSVVLLVVGLMCKRCAACSAELCQVLTCQEVDRGPEYAIE